MSCRWCEKPETQHLKDCPQYGEKVNSWALKTKRGYIGRRRYEEENVENRRKV